MNSQEIENIIEEHSRNQNLIEEYTREVMGNLYDGQNGFTVEKLISQSREYCKSYWSR